MFPRDHAAQSPTPSLHKTKEYPPLASSWIALFSPTAKSHKPPASINSLPNSKPPGVNGPHVFPLFTLHNINPASGARNGTPNLPKFRLHPSPGCFGEKNRNMSATNLAPRSNLRPANLHKFVAHRSPAPSSSLQLR